MELRELLKELFEYKKLTWLIAYYETYYQMSLAFYVKKSGFENENMVERVSKLELDIDPEKFFINLIDLANLYFIKENPLEYIEKDIKHIASVNSLNDFVEKDEALLNKEAFASETLKEITNERIHKEVVDNLVKSELPHRVKVWRGIIDTSVTEEISQKVLESYGQQ